MSQNNNANTVSVEELPPRVKPSPRGKANLNMTPMIDVIFQLLIFFIVSTEFRTIEGLLPANLPEQGIEVVDPTLLPDLNIVISRSFDPNLDPTVHPFTSEISCPELGAIPRPADYAGSGRPMDVLTPLQELTRRLQAQIQSVGDLYRTKTPVFIQADRTVPYGEVTLVYDAILAARMERVAFAPPGG